MIGLSIIMIIFMFPETKWDRTTSKELSPSPSSKGKVDRKTADGEKNSETDIEQVPTQASLGHPTRTSLGAGQEGLTPAETATRDPYLGKGCPSKQQWIPFQPNKHPFHTIFLDIWIL